MKYFYDTEFLEGTQTPYQWGLKTDTWLRIFATFFIILGTILIYVFKNTWLLYSISGVSYLIGWFLWSLSLPSTPPTIDLISIGIVSEDNREYYAMSKDFNLKEAWNRYQWKDVHDIHKGMLKYKEYWIRENVLKPIFNEWKISINSRIVRLGLSVALNEMDFNYRNFKYCIKCIGKSNKQIAEEVVSFINSEPIVQTGTSNTASQLTQEAKDNIRRGYLTPHFYGYYSAYDHVALCWLFGKMNDLPEGFPMYTIDLKQMLDEKIKNKYLFSNQVNEEAQNKTLEWWLNEIVKHPNYPTQTNEHSAIHDARWNKQLHNFLKSL